MVGNQVVSVRIASVARGTEPATVDGCVMRIACSGLPLRKAVKSASVGEAAAVVRMNSMAFATVSAGASAAGKSWLILAIRIVKKRHAGHKTGVHQCRDHTECDTPFPARLSGIPIQEQDSLKKIGDSFTGDYHFAIFILGQSYQIFRESTGR